MVFGVLLFVILQCVHIFGVAHHYIDAVTGTNVGYARTLLDMVKTLGEIWYIDALTPNAREFLDNVGNRPIRSLTVVERYTMAELFNHSMLQITVRLLCLYMRMDHANCEQRTGHATLPVQAYRAANGVANFYAMPDKRRGTASRSRSACSIHEDTIVLATTVPGLDSYHDDVSGTTLVGSKEQQSVSTDCCSVQKDEDQGDSLAQCAIDYHQVVKSAEEYRKCPMSTVSPVRSNPECRISPFPVFRRSQQWYCRSRSSSF